jgi:hypothetical protein
MSYVYDDFGKLKDNCLIVEQPLSNPVNIRGQRSDANWCISASHTIKDSNLKIVVYCNFWTKKEALNFLKTGLHKSKNTNELLYKIKNN